MSLRSWEVEQILRDLRRHTAGAPDWDSFEQRLKTTVDQYAGSRTIEARMVREVAQEAYGYVAEALAAPTAERDAHVQKLLGVIERLEENLATSRNNTDYLRKQLEAQRVIAEERTATKHGLVDVTFKNDRRHWTVADLEEVAYRLRLGGAVDDTTVEVSEWSAKSQVVDGSMVTLDLRPAPTPPARPDPLPNPVERGPVASLLAALGPPGVIAALTMLMVVLGALASR